jgi:hypothetical protein
MDFGDAGKARAPFEKSAQLAKLLRGAHYEHFHATIAQVSDVAPNLYLGCGALREVAVPNALDGAGDQILSGLFWLGHEPKNCNRHRLFASEAHANSKEARSMRGLKPAL